ncbi:MAG: class I SAM-dependent RNA methyltransferase [Akkermansiaceae bacterium]|nr:class I SAM-dependent RNA methyltransferase [Akkermansiaceae bacterium]
MPTPPRKFRAEPFDYHQELEITIDSLSNLGAGVGRIVLDSPPTDSETKADEAIDSPQSDNKDGPALRSSEGEGWVIFVPFALPGERVRIRIWRNDKNCSHADLVDVLEPSPNRVEPKCALFGECGGCQYQHLSYENQLQWKQDQLSALFQHMSDIDHPVEVPIPSPKPWNYRSKITPHFQKPRGATMGPIGFLYPGTRNRIIDVTYCPIAMEEINNALPEERKRIQQSAEKFKKGATLLLRATNNGVHTNPRDVTEETIGDLKFSFLAGDFFQNNPFILPAFVDHVATQAKQDCRFLVDAYCGSGLFALSLAKHFESVAGVEVSESAADWARRNAKDNNIDNVTILASSAEHIFADITFPGSETAVVIDPPRKGCNPEFLAQLFAFAPKRIVYVSCNPATQIRDLKEFEGQSYRIVEIQPFDLFPQTRHLECVVTLERTT